MPDRAQPRPADRAQEACLRLLALRPRTRAELDRALRRRGFEDDVVAEVLDRYSDVGLIDDEAFARAWVSSRHHGRGLARRALAAELRRKGVTAETVGAALDDLDSDAEEATARALVERRLRIERVALARGLAPASLVRRLVGVLARKGYPPGFAYRVVKEVLAEAPDVGAAADLLDVEEAVEDPGDFDQLRS